MTGILAREVGKELKLSFDDECVAAMQLMAYERDRENPQSRKCLLI